MATSHTSPAEASEIPHSFPRLGARRLLVLAGLTLFLAGTILGDVFAVFVLHPNADRIGQALTAATAAVRQHRPEEAGRSFEAIGGFLENRGTKVDAHAHMIGFGYLAMLLAMLFPWIRLSESASRRLAALLIIGGVLLPVGVFAIHYVGMAYSPLESIGWASIVADAGGLLVVVACAGFLVGLWRQWRSAEPPEEDALLRERSWAGRVLLAGGTLLILAGFVHGAWFAGVDLYAQERQDHDLLAAMAESAALDPGPGLIPERAGAALNDYGMLQADHAVKIAAHSHVIEFGLIALMAGFFQPFVFLSEKWKRRWALALLAGSVILPVAVQAELKFGLLAGGVADAGGALVITALAGMLTGVLRYTGRLDSLGDGATGAISGSATGGRP
ncbi:MAG TPA: hypothetical protein VJW51_02785 [Candidatus Acidoferrales bacterium]|nr:hypothetical protein [Candidatus Acidoferrales bacterium]